MNLFKTVGIAETCSTICLFFVAMPIKYMAGDPSWVQIVGPIHGMLWIMYIGMLWQGYVNQQWNMKAVITGGLLSIPPGGPIWFDARIGHAQYQVQNSES